MKFWDRVKTGFAYGFGGGLGASIGWSLGGWLMGMLGRIWRIVVFLVVGGWGSYQVAGYLANDMAKDLQATHKPAMVKQQR